MPEKHPDQLTVYPRSYDADLLVPIERASSRNRLGLGETLPFSGRDVWHAYEISCLNPDGLPRVYLGKFIFDCHSPRLIESKSLKLYLNSHNQVRYAGRAALHEVLVNDLSAVAGADVSVELRDLSAPLLPITEPEGLCLDDLDITISHYLPEPELLFSKGDENVEETCYTNLFRSNCPISNQPDWATVSVTYSGSPIDHAALLAYLVSYRLHNDYHENCVEQIFVDIQQRCRPTALTVQANFLRRGGLDINPMRSTEKLESGTNSRFIRQ